MLMQKLGWCGKCHGAGGQLVGQRLLGRRHKRSCRRGVQAALLAHSEGG